MVELIYQQYWRKWEAQVNEEANVLILWENRNCFPDNLMLPDVRSVEFVIIHVIYLKSQSQPTITTSAHHQMRGFASYIIRLYLS